MKLGELAFPPGGGVEDLIGVEQAAVREMVKLNRSIHRPSQPLGGQALQWHRRLERGADKPHAARGRAHHPVLVRPDGVLAFRKLADVAARLARGKPWRPQHRGRGGRPAAGVAGLRLRPRLRLRGWRWTRARRPEVRTGPAPMKDRMMRALRLAVSSSAINTVLESGTAGPRGVWNEFSR